MTTLSKVKPEVLTSSSRIVHENLNAAQGVSIYGKLANFLGVNMQHIDALSRFLSGFSSQATIAAVQDEKYHNSSEKIPSFIRRNVYMNEREQLQMNLKAQALGTMAQAGTEAAIQYGARALAAFAQKQDNYLTFEQLYSILMLFIRDAEPGADTARAMSELNKIRNSFPLSVAEKSKLYRSVSINNDLGSLDVSSILTAENRELRQAAAYFLTVLQRQLYHDQQPGHTLLPDYYSLLELNGVQSTNLMAENQANYDEIAMNQVAYLQISRALSKHLALEMPNINIEQIIQRNTEAARYDPYAIRRMKVKQAAIKGAKAATGIGELVTGIYLENPKLMVCGVSTALSQFTSNEELIESAQKKCLEWGIERDDVDKIAEGSAVIKIECNENDMNSIE